MSNQKFELYLSRAEKAVKGVAINYRKAANIAIAHFEKSGDLSLCQRILDSMNTKTRSGVVKRSGYLNWLVTFSPAILDPEDKKKLVKNKADDAVKFDVKAALKTDMWTFSANNDEEFVFSSDDIMKVIESAYRRCTKENAKAVDAPANKTLNALGDFIKKHDPEFMLAN